MGSGLPAVSISGSSLLTLTAGFFPEDQSPLRPQGHQSKVPFHLWTKRHSHREERVSGYGRALSWIAFVSKHPCRQAPPPCPRPAHSEKTAHPPPSAAVAGERQASLGVQAAGQLWAPKLHKREGKPGAGSQGWALPKVQVPFRAQPPPSTSHQLFPATSPSSQSFPTTAPTPLLCYKLPLVPAEWGVPPRARVPTPASVVPSSQSRLPCHL